MKIAFRVDASCLIGAGHVMRCLVLANALREQGHQILFVCRNYPGNLNKVISKNEYAVRELSFKGARIYQEQNYSDDYDQWLWVTQQQDANETSLLLKSEQLDWLIVDHYSLDYVWEKQLRVTSKKIMVIDDLANRKHDCDILLDQNYYSSMQKRYRRYVACNTAMLLGPRYALIRDEILRSKNLRAAAQKKITSTPKVLLSMGGLDPDNMTLDILKYIKNNAVLSDYQVDVVVGLINPHRRMIENFCSKHNNLNFHRSPNYFISLLTAAEFVIGAGGISVYERCILGIPSLVFSLSDNQKQICSDVADFGAHIFLKKISDLKDGIQMLTNEKLNRLTEKSLSLFLNYVGAHGVVDAIQAS